MLPGLISGRLLRRVAAARPELPYLLYVPRRRPLSPRLFVAVHGISRNADEHAARFSALAERFGVVLVAPVFSRELFPDYQRLGRRGRGGRADQALERVVAEVGASTGARTDRLYLFGYSGGGQFVHRFAMAHPRRVARVAVAAAGWYTFPDPEIRYPRGLRGSKSLPGVRFDAEAFLRIPMTVLVGERDSERDQDLRVSPGVDLQQGATRLERGRRWVEAMEAAARRRGLDTDYSFHTLPKSGHSFLQSMRRGGLGGKTFDFLFGKPPALPRPLPFETPLVFPEPALQEGF